MEEPEHVIAQFVYRSVPRSRHHAVSVMLVRRLEGSNVVARIDPLGRGEKMAPPRGRLRVVGPWTTTASRRYAKARIGAART